MSNHRSSHIADRAAFLAALAKDDPERLLAVAHTRSCQPCGEAFAEGLGLVALLDESQPLSPPSPDLLARAATAIERQSAGEGAVTRRIVCGSALGVLVAWAFQLMVGSGFSLAPPHALVSLAVLAIAIGGVTVLRHSAKLTVLLMVATSFALVSLAGTAEGLAPGIGIRCAFRELWAAGLTWAVATVVARREEAMLSRGAVTVIVAAGALAAHAGQHLSCEVPHAHAHLLLFHFGAVLLAIAVTSLGAGRRSAIPARR